MQCKIYPATIDNVYLIIFVTIRVILPLLVQLQVNIGWFNPLNSQFSLPA